MSRLAAACTVLAAGNAPGVPLFSGGSPIYGCAGNPLGIEAADIDGDGALDLVILTPSDLVALRGRADGSFEPPIVQDTGIDPVSSTSLLLLADVNVDGRSDAVLLHRFGTRAVVLLGLTGARFAPPLLLDAGAAMVGVTVAQMDGDGFPDVAAATDASSGVRFLRGRGDGTFETGLPVADAGDDITGIASGDVDGDGDADLVLTRWSNGLSVLRGHGDGTFGPRTDHGAGLLGDRLAVADLNGDGRSDVVSAAGSQVHVFHGSADGSLVATATLSGGPDLTGLALGDLNGDGRTDIATSNSYQEHHTRDQSRVWMFTSSAAGTFERAEVRITYDPPSLAIADLDGDGRGDLVVGNLSRGVSVLLGSTRGLPGTRSFASGAAPVDLGIADLDADGLPDVVTADFEANGVSVLRGLGGRELAPGESFLTGFGPVAVATGDVNADGRQDAVVACRDANTISVLPGNGDGSLGTNTDFGTGGSPGSIALADVDRDGRPDAIATVPMGVAVLHNLGGGFFGAPTTWPVSGSVGRLAVGDLDADGEVDVVVTRASSNDVAVLLGDGGGGFAAPRSLAIGRAQADVAIGDPNGDGHADVVVAHNLGISLLDGNGDGTFQPAREVAFQSASAVAVHDLDGDGRDDLAVANYRSVGIWLAAVGGAFSDRFDVAAGLSSLALAVADLDGDRRADLAVANSGSNTVTTLHNEIVPVPVVVEALSARATEGGVLLEWRLPDPGAWRGIEVERAPAALGPYTRIDASRLEPSRTMHFEDAFGSSGAWYRLMLDGADGRFVVAGPVQAAPSDEVAALRLDPPQASASHVRIAFVLGPSRSKVWIEVFDARGARVHRLVSGALGAGAHVVDWDRRDAAGARVARGVYLVHLGTPAGSATRKLVLAHR